MEKLEENRNELHVFSDVRLPHAFGKYSTAIREHNMHT